MLDATQTSLTRIAARRLQQVARGDYSPNVRSKAQLAVLDVLGATCTGVDSDLAASVASFIRGRHKQPAEAYAFIGRKDVDAETAAFTNAIAAHLAIRDDMHLASVAHIGGIVVSAALAVGQREHWTGEQVLRAVIGGYEMGAVLGTSLRAEGSFNPHFRPSGLIGAFAAAGALATVMFADEDRISNALSLAVNTAAGVNEWACTGASDIFLHMGTAARSAITCCDLAAAGMESSDTVLEGEHGFFQAYGVRETATKAFRAWLALCNVGRGILDMRFKPVGSCNYTQSSTALAQRIRETTNVVPEDIETIVITTTTPAINYPGCDSTGPYRTIVDSKMSIQYGVSVALTAPRLDEDAWNPALNPKVETLARKCHLAVDGAFDEAYKKGMQAARVEIKLKDGTTLTEETQDVPWTTAKGVPTRAVSELCKHVSVPAAEQMVEDCMGLYRLKDCNLLLSGCRKGRGRVP